MNLIKLIVITLLTFQSVYAQSWEVKVSGNIHHSDGSKVSEVPVILFQNKDTVSVVKTDKNGAFVFNTTFTTGNDYTLGIDDENRNFRSNTVDLFHKEDTAKMSEYQVDLLFPKMIRDKFDNSAYYNLNETRRFENFETGWLKGFLDEYPGMCLEFVQTINPAEKGKIAKKRMKYFREELEKAGYDLNRITFRTDLLVLHKDQLKEDQRSRIQGIVISMDGDCKNRK
jgi:hypothetical protein